MSRLPIIAIGLLALAPALAGANWAQWRGPSFDGSTPDKPLPSKWSKTENVRWVKPLPGYSGATPITWQTTVFVSSPDSHKDLYLLAFELDTGTELWRRKVGSGDFEKGRNNTASPSPVTDGKRVVAMFATGDLAAYDLTGAELWRRDLAQEYGKFANMWIYGSSPMLHEGRLYIQALQSKTPDYSHSRDDKPDRESFLICIDAATGKNVWRHIRPTDAVSEAQESYATPVPFESGGVAQVLVVGGNYLTAHSAATGEEIWRCGGLNDRGEKYWRIVPSPVVAGDIIVVSGPKRDPVLGIRGGGKGLVTSTHIAWRYKDFPTDCVTPLLYEGKLYVLDGDRQVMTCLDPKTGRQFWRGELGIREIFRASPLGGDGKIYCVSEAGTVVILEGGEELKVLSTIRMGDEPVRASIVAADGRLLIRTASHLYCIASR